MEILAWVIGSGFVVGVVGFFLWAFNERWITNNLSWEEVGGFMMLIGIISCMACIPLALILSAMGRL
jgi:hypothetical protein